MSAIAAKKLMVRFVSVFWWLASSHSSPRPLVRLMHLIYIQKSSIACIIPAAGAAWAAPLYFYTPTLAYDGWPCDVGKYSHPFLTYHFRSTTVENTPSSPYRLNSAAGHTENYDVIKSKGVRINNENSAYYVSVFQKFIQQSIIEKKANTSKFLSDHSFLVL